MVFINLTAGWFSDVAIQILSDEEDNRRTPLHMTSFVKREIWGHFEIKDVNNNVKKIFIQFLTCSSPRFFSIKC